MNAIFSKKAPDGVIAGDSLRDRALDPGFLERLADHRLGD
jgi:hypothetical protein